MAKWLDDIKASKLIGDIKMPKFVDDVADWCKSLGKGDTSTKITSNLGKEIDITPSSNHSTVTSNPGYKGTPNSSVDILDSNGDVVTRRWYDSNGNAYRDVDMTNHGNPTTHPEWPHGHIWEYDENGIPTRR